jgi:hypothetical protein
MKLGAPCPGYAVRRPAVLEVRGFREVDAGIDMPVLRCHDVVELPVVVLYVLTDGPGHGGSALHRKRAAFAEVVLDVDDDECTCHQISSVLFVDCGDCRLAAVQAVDHGRQFGQ